MPFALNHFYHFLDRLHIGSLQISLLYRCFNPQRFAAAREIAVLLHQLRCVRKRDNCKLIYKIPIAVRKISRLVNM